MQKWSQPSRVEELRPERGLHPVPRRAAGGAAGPRVRGYRDATLLVADVMDLPGLARAAGAERLVAILDELFRAADRAAGSRGLARVAAAGGFYCVVAGVPSPRIDHAAAIADLAIELAQAAGAIERPGGRGIGLRLGLHTGPVVAALEGRGAVRELWGESVRIAERLATKGVPGLVQVSAATLARLEGTHRLEPRPRLPGAAVLDAWFLLGRRSH